MLENIDEGLPEPMRPPLRTTVYFDSDRSHDQVTRQWVSRIMCFSRLTPISWYSKIQSAIKTSSYSIEFCTGRVSAEEAIYVQYMLSSLGVPMKVHTDPCGENLVMIIYSTNPN